MDSPSDYLDLYDYRLRVLALYRDRRRALAEGDDPVAVLQRFRAARDELFACHPQSALDPDQKRDFRGLSYFPYLPEAVVEATIDSRIEQGRLEIQTSGDQAMPMSRVGRVTFSFAGQPASLALYWIDVYGGGLFLPFRDATAPAETYGGGRYLFDTVKGSDFRMLARNDETWQIELDFNYAYNPSCAYNYRWACPLAPPENRLPFRISAGEKVFAPHPPAPLPPGVRGSKNPHRRSLRPSNGSGEE
jgi:uncharacterized protein (DUF1684 family)